MTLHVRAAPKADWPWLVEHTHCALTTDFSAIEAIQLLAGYPEDPTAYRIRGMVGYCNTTLTAVQLHMAVDSPIVWRTLLRPALAYPFVQQDRRICLGVIPASNRRSVAFAKAVGFRETHRVEDGWAPNVDLVFLELRREQCRHLDGTPWRAAREKHTRSRVLFRERAVCHG